MAKSEEVSQLILADTNKYHEKSIVGPMFEARNIQV